MNIKMNDSTYEYIIKKGGTFLIKSVSVSCGWAGTVKSLWGEASKGIDNENAYDLFYYKDIKIYIYNKLKLSDTVEINLRYNLPLLGQSFEIKGIEI